MASIAFETGREFAAEMNARDPLAKYREEFLVPKAPDGSDCIYFCGHSLGLQPREVRECLDQELEGWGRLGVEAHFRARNPWLGYHRLLTNQLARVVGANPEEVVVMNSLTVNLHLMMVSFYRPTRKRHKIVIEASAFPSDQYAVKSQIRFHGFDPATSLIEVKPRVNESIIREEDIRALIEREGASIALVLFGGINYSSGQAFDMASVAEAAHAQGCLVGFDLAHAAGNLRLKLHNDGADFAVWCSYKYLNGGPGCVGGCFVHERHARAFELPRFAGWWGNEEKTRFRMGPDFEPTPGAEGWQLSNPSIFSMAALRASMDIFDRAGMDAVREKSVQLTGYAEYLLDRHASEKFSIITPRDPERRGAQLSLGVPQVGRAVCDRLAAQGVLCDFREPDILRFAPAPLYCSYTDVYRFVESFISEIG